MKHIVTAFSMTLLVVLAGCDVPGRPELRIGVLNSPGSAVIHVAAEERLFQRYSVDVVIVELNDGHECWMALANGNLDAAVLPYNELRLENQSNTNDAGILMLLAAACPHPELPDGLVEQSLWHRDELDVLVGSRGDLMRRRVEWQRILLAYEHARLLLTATQPKQVQLVSEYEHRSVLSIIGDVETWQLFGVQQQDSLLSVNGPYKDMKARWQGQFDFSASIAASPAQSLEGKQINQPGEKVR